MIDQNTIRWVTLAILSVLVLVVAGCASTPPAPVEDRSLGGHQGSRRGVSVGSDAGVYRVRSGDTLYSIAFRNGLDFRELARLNRIDAPFTIYPGQEIRLGSAPPVRRETASTTPRSVSSAPAPSSNPIAPFAGAAGKPASVRQEPVVAKSDAAPQPLTASRPPPADPISNTDISWRWQRQWADRLRRVDHRQAQLDPAVGLRPQSPASGSRRRQGQGGAADCRDGFIQCDARHAPFRNPQERQAGRSTRIPAKALMMNAGCVKPVAVAFRMPKLASLPCADTEQFQ